MLFTEAPGQAWKGQSVSALGRRLSRSGSLLAAVALAAPVGLSATSAGAATARGPATTAIQHRNVRVCPAPPIGHAACYTVLRQAVTPSGKPAPSASSPTGLSPSAIDQVYGWTPGSNGQGNGAGETIAIVDAYDAPNIASDLNTFSDQYGLPRLGACGAGATACFTKVDQTGGTNYPRSNSGWDLEISLDVEWAHAIAPDASILLVEARSSSLANLMAAEDYAGAHATYVSNSWGSSEFSGESSDDANFAAPGTSFFVAAGDAGLGAQYPSSSPDVISVGGTSLALTMSGATVTSAVETGWSSSGGGCSAYEPATSAQRALPTESQAGCGASRATPDVALDADPSSGVSVYDSEGYQGQRGWFQVGGTSASTPMWAARSADTGTTVGSSYVYGASISYNDIVSGNNGAPALPGYDLVTGRGSWIDGGAVVTAGASSGSGGGGGTSSDSVWVPSGGISYSAAPHGKAMLVQVGVVDANGPVSSATVSITVENDTTSAIATASGTTGSNGTVTFKLTKAAAASYTTTITGITGANLTWASSSGESSYTAYYGG